MEKILIIIVVVLSAFLIFFGIRLWYADRAITNERIVSVEIQITNSSEWIHRQKYLYTNENVYEIENRLFIWHTRSMDTYNKLKQLEWKTCNIETIWKRIWFFSMYKSVISVWDCD